MEREITSETGKHRAWIVRDDETRTVRYYYDTFYAGAHAYVEIRPDCNGVLHCFSESSENDVTFASLDDAENWLTDWAESDMSVAESEGGDA